MYRGTFTDSMGRTRKNMGYFTLNQATFNKTRKVYIVQARDKASAANKINRRYKACISPSNLREVRKGRGELMKLLEKAKYM